MTRKSWQLSRRDLIKGAGIAMALPYLNAMSGASVASAADSATRTFSAVSTRVEPWSSLARKKSPEPRLATMASKIRITASFMA